MKKNTYHIIGMMSGTSLDGIDLVTVTFYNDETWSFTIQQAETIPYTMLWQEKLRNAVDLNPDALEQLNREYSVLLAGAINDFIRRHNLNHIDAVCTHGHTVFHQPEKGLTLQIGNTPELAKQLGHTLVCDFRTQDVALGGQGAPLVPIGDRLLFPEYDYCLNLGGFANISFDDDDGNRIAFDICPANIVLNHYALKLGKDYDDGGREAAKGTIDAHLLQQLNALEFYALSSPKSLGIEWVKTAFLPLINTEKTTIQAILRTLVAHIAMQISRVLRKNSRVLITGGGACNTFLMKQISAMSDSEVVVPEKEIIAFKEALVFGLLGVLKIRGEVNCLSSATGASRDHSSGKIYKS